MGKVAKYGDGTFCWVELITSDPSAAKDFYGSLFGWHMHDTPMEDGGTYTMIQQEALDIGALYAASEAQAQEGVPPHWFSYVAVDDLDSACDRVRALGGEVTTAPCAVGSAGRVAVIKDPEGVRFGLWEAADHIGARIVNEPNTLCWNELLTNNPAQAEAFYSKLFDWDVHTADMGGGTYTSFMRRGHAMGGMMKVPDEEIPAHWMVYFAVENTDAIVEHLQEHGGSVLYGPHTAADVGRLAAVTDPQGAAFSVIDLERTDEPEFPAASEAAGMV